jgi:hypothetical protein
MANRAGSERENVVKRIVLKRIRFIIATFSGMRLMRWRRHRHRPFDAADE